MKLISLTPCMDVGLWAELRASGIPKELATGRFWHDPNGDFRILRIKGCYVASDGTCPV